MPIPPSFQVTVPEQFETIKFANCPAQMVGLLTVGVGFIQPQLGGDVYIVDAVQRSVPFELNLVVIVCEAPSATKPITLVIL